MKAFSLANAPHLPVTGSSHPLVQQSWRRLSGANAVTLAGALLLFAGAYLWAMRSGDVATPPPQFPRGPVVSPTPPVITPRTPVQGVTPISDARNAIPEPKPDVVPRNEIGYDDPGTGAEIPREGIDPFDFPSDPFAYTPPNIQRPDTIAVFD